MSAIREWLHSERPLYWGFALIMLWGFVTTILERHTSLSCIVGWTTCVSTQGKMLSSEALINMLDSCNDFTRNGIGRIALALSVSEIIEENEKFERRTGQSISPLLMANYAREKLYESRLDFDRDERNPSEQYDQIKRSCRELHRDFYDDSKWTRARLLFRGRE